MASKRRTTRRRSATTRRARRTTLKFKVKAQVAHEIWAIMNLAFGVVVILSIQGAFGVIGDFFVQALRPVLGWGIYVVPGVFIVISLMMFFSKRVHFGPSRILGLFLFMISILSVFHLAVPVEQIYDYAALGTHGGYAGFVSNFLLLRVLHVGRVGAAVVFVSMFFVSLILLFEVSLGELIRMVIPSVKFEMVNDGRGGTRRSNRLADKEDGAEEVEIPEIMIRKAKIGGRNKDADDVIFADDDIVDLEEEDDDLIVNKTGDVEAELTKGAKKQDDYVWEFPSLDLLKPGDSNVTVDEDVLRDNADKIRKKLNQFGIDVKMHEVNVGPTVLQYTLKPHEGVKLSKITGLKNDLALALAAERVRIEAPIPGKSLVGIEVPNSYRATVHMREILESAEFTDARSKLTLPLGRDVSGKPVVANLDTMPHLLIAGATGSGKSVAMNSFLIALLFQNSPKDLKLILIDPKRVELSCYNSIPHLLSPVITDPEKAAISMRWVVAEMTRRYGELSSHRVRNIQEHNDLKDVEQMPRIIVVIDELADLMMAAGKEVEASICRIAQMARAVGIHLIIATQRPSVDVITGLIKANIPSRIAFSVSSSIDSRTILDGMGAEDLVGRGDMLYLPSGKNKPVRIQGIYVSNEEIERVANRVKLTVEPDYDDTITSSHTAKQQLVGIPVSGSDGSDDSLYEEAYKLVMESRKASASLLQRRLKVGYARAARLIDLLEENGVVGPADGAKPRKILV